MQEQQMFSLRKASGETPRHRRLQEEQWAAVEKNGRRLISKEEEALKKDLLLQAIESFHGIDESVLNELQVDIKKTRTSQLKKGEAKKISNELEQFAVDLAGNQSAAPIGKVMRFLHLCASKTFQISKI